MGGQPSSGLGPFGDPIPSGPPVLGTDEIRQIGAPSLGSGGLFPTGESREPRDREPQEGRGREGVLIGAAVLFGALVVLGGLLGFQRYRSTADESALDSVQTESPAEDEVSGESEPETSPEPDETEANDSEVDGSEAGGTEQQNSDRDESESSSGSGDDELDFVPTECPSSIQEEICDAVRFVEVETGRPFKEFPEVELLEDEAFDNELLEDFETYRDEFDEDEIVLKATGLFNENLSLYDTYLSLLEVGVLGFYDPETGQLVVRGGEFNLFGQSVLVHELVHAHDDQWYDLDRDDFANDDAEYGFSAVVEGNASRLENAWISSLTAEQEAQVEFGAIAALSEDDLALMFSLPPILIELTASPYEDGEAFVKYRIDVEGEEVLEELFSNPPQSSEQVLHPEVEYQSVVDVARPPANGTVTSSGTIGELVLSFWLGREAAAGWGGDSFVTWSDGSTDCMTTDVVADTPEDLEQIEVAARKWTAGAKPGLRDVEVVDAVDQSLIRITGCYGTD